MKVKHAILGLVLTLTMIAVLALSAWLAFRNKTERPIPQIPFVASEWLAGEFQGAEPTVRSGMIEDLMANYPLKGKTRFEIEKELGPPFPWTTHPYDMIIPVGPKRRLDSDIEFIGFKFGADGRVVSYELFMQ